ncbi:MAG: ice-binding family protein [Pseudomonadota bacterium]
MRKDSFWYGEYGENNKIREGGLKMQAEGGLKMQAIDTKRMLIIEAEKGGAIMKRFKAIQTYLLFILILILSVFSITGCGGGGDWLPGDTTAPTVSSTIPADIATDVAINRNITATFSEAMDPLTITTATFTLTQGATPVPGAVTYVGTTATFNPTSNLAVSTVYTATITTGAKDLADNALAADKVWSFTTRATTAAGPALVNLGTAGNFVILAKSGISTVPNSAITGDIGVSPIDQTALTGFSETMDASNEFSTSAQVTGKLYAADYAVPTPANLTTAVSDMETAYTDAAGRATPDATELGAGEIGGLTIVPGLYKWGTGVLISTDVTLNGGPDDVWIFQISGDLTQASATQVILTGGALPKNIFWQSFGAVTLNTTAHFEGIVLSYTEITLATGATVNGRLLSQTAVTLDANTVVQPAP